MKKSLCLITSIFITLSIGSFELSAQPAPPDNLNLKPMREWLKDNWYTPFYGVATNDRFKDKFYSDVYRDARREMYNYIDNIDNSVEGVYSGFTVNWTFGGTGSNPQPINAEHTVPQSFFRPDGQDDASEPMRSDLHHVFPSYNSWNSTRSNHPFADIPDNETTKWMILNQDQSSIPTSNIDGYSEFSSSGGFSRFEPREVHKGNVARAIFYFYTMFEDESDVTEEIGSVANVELLLQWHMQDPVDAAEIERNNKVAEYQGNRNPYIVHPEAVQAAWSDEPLVSSAHQDLQHYMNYYPNPANKTLNLEVDGLKNWNLNIYNLHGQLVQENRNVTFNKYSIDISILKCGLYTIQFYNENVSEIYRFIKE